MLFHAALLIVGVAVSVSEVYSAKIPDYIHICKRNDPNVEKCVLESIESLRPYLKKGIPELEVPALEPLVLPQVGVPTPDANGFMAVGRNINVFGGSNFEVTKLKIDWSTPTRPTIHFALNLPRLDFEGEYEVNTRILVLPIQGKGPIKFNATNTKADAVLYGQTYKKGNNNYLRFIKMDMSLKMEDYNIYLGNLFNGDKLLGEATNQALNENKKDFMRALNPIVTEAVIKMVLDIANKITKTNPYDDLFPPK